MTLITECAPDDDHHPAGEIMGNGKTFS
jgi:hypothetical protein